MGVNGANGNGRPRRRRALVTGGAGSIGSHLPAALLEPGWDLLERDDRHVVVDSVPSPRVPSSGRPSELGSVSDDEGIEDMLHRQPSIEKIGAAIGWAPERSPDAILADVVAERRANREPAAV